jgi:hypothetical protein
VSLAGDSHRLCVMAEMSCHESYPRDLRPSRLLWPGREPRARSKQRRGGLSNIRSFVTLDTVIRRRAVDRARQGQGVTPICCWHTTVVEAAPISDRRELVGATWTRCGPRARRASPARRLRRLDLRRWVVGLPGLEPGTSSLSAIEGSPLCNPAFSQVAHDRQGRSNAL